MYSKAVLKGTRQARYPLATILCNSGLIRRGEGGGSIASTNLGISPSLSVLQLPILSVLNLSLYIHLYSPKNVNIA